MINRVVLVGRFTKDVEVRKTQSGLSVASFIVACDRRGTKGEDRQADFISCVAWRQPADYLGQYARKGAMVGVEGRIQTRSYDRNDGTKQYVTEVVCDNVSILESRTQKAENAQAQQTYGQGYRQEQSSYADLSATPSNSDLAQSSGFDIDPNADLPF